MTSIFGVVGWDEKGSGELLDWENEAPDDEEFEVMLSLRLPLDELPDELSPDEKLLTLAVMADWRPKAYCGGSNSWKPVVGSYGNPP